MSPDSAWNGEWHGLIKSLIKSLLGRFPVPEPTAVFYSRNFGLASFWQINGWLVKNTHSKPANIFSNFTICILLLILNLYGGMGLGLLGHNFQMICIIWGWAWGMPGFFMKTFWPRRGRPFYKEGGGCHSKSWTLKGCHPLVLFSLYKEEVKVPGMDRVFL